MPESWIYTGFSAEGTLRLPRPRSFLYRRSRPKIGMIRGYLCAKWRQSETTSVKRAHVRTIGQKTYLAWGVPLITCGTSGGAKEEKGTC